LPIDAYSRSSTGSNLRTRGISFLATQDCFEPRATWTSKVGSEEEAVRILADNNASHRSRMVATTKARRAASAVPQSSEDLFAPGGIFYAGP
jgi:hypothetical protein